MLNALQSQETQTSKAANFAATVLHSIGTALFHTPIQRMQLFQDVSRCFKFHSFILPVKSFAFRYCARPQEAPCHLSCPSCHGSPANLQASTAVGVARGITRQRWRQHEMSKKTFQYISIRMFASSCLKHVFQKSNTLHHIANLPASVTSSPFSFSTRAAAAHFPQRRARLFNEAKSIETCIVRLEVTVLLVHILYISVLLHYVAAFKLFFPILFGWTRGFQRLILWQAILVHSENPSINARNSFKLDSDI